MKKNQATSVGLKNKSLKNIEKIVGKIEENKRKAGSTNFHKPMGPSINDAILIDCFMNPLTSPKIVC